MKKKVASAAVKKGATMSSLKKMASNQRGVALLMVMAAIALMSFLLVDFTFETELNKIKVYNQIDKDQARMNAEAGLNFALAKLKLYQVGRNYIEKTEGLKGVVNPSDIESIATMPFIYPIPEQLGKDLQAKTVIKEFSKSAILQGSMQLTITPVSGFLNPNNMRLVKAKKDSDDDDNFDEDTDENGKKKITPQAYIEIKLLETLKDAFEKKREEDDEFDSLYGNTDPKLLIKELKYFVNSPENFMDSEKAEIQQLYENAEITPKHAPMASIDEMYLLAGWSDTLIELIKDRLATHEVSIIPVNKLTDKQLKLLFPNITEEQIEEFFKYLNGDKEAGEQPKQFKSASEFKAFMVGNLGVVTDEKYEERSKEFESAGLRIGVAGKLYKVESVGEYKRATFKIIAFVDLPIRPVPVKKKKKDDEVDEDLGPDSLTGGSDIDKNKEREREREEKEKEEEKKPPLQLMSPRVVEVRHG